MSKQKTNKSLSKRLKISGKGKLLRRHQFAAGHLKRNKSKSAIKASKKSTGIFAGEIKKYKRIMGV